MISELQSSRTGQRSPTVDRADNFFAKAVAQELARRVAQAAPSPLFAPAGNAPQAETLGPAGQAAIRSVFGFDPTRSSAGAVENAFAFGNSDGNLLDLGGGLGFSDISSRGAASAYVSFSRIAELANLPNAKETIAAQEVAHKLLASHPDLRGKFSAVESEAIGNAVSLAVNPDFLAHNMVNTLQSSRNPNYAGIAELQLVALGRVNKAMGLGGEGSYDGGADLMNRFAAYVRSIGGNEASISMETLRGFAGSIGADPRAFVEQLGNETRSLFTGMSQKLIERARSRPNF